MANQNEDKILIKVSSQTFEEIEFTISKKKEFKKLFQRYCERNNINLKEVQFVYAGKKINENQTPEDIDIEYGDEITCSIL